MSRLLKEKVFPGAAAAAGIVTFALIGCERHENGSAPPPESGESGEGASAAGGPVEVTTENFEEVVLQADVPVMVDVWAVWCGPCREMAPVVDQIAAETAGRAVIAKLDADKNAEIVQKYGVTGLPSFLFFRDGELVKTMVGITAKERLVSGLELES